MFERPSIYSGAQPAEANTTYPGHTCCMMYASHDFNTDGGWLSVCGNGSTFDYDIATSQYSWFNDEMSSWYCGKNIAFDFCKNNPGDDCSGDNGNTGAGNSRSVQIGNNDSLTTLRGRPYDPEV